MESRLAKMEATQNEHDRRLNNADEMQRQFTQVVIDIASMKTSLEAIPKVVNGFMESYAKDKEIAAENARENGKRWDSMVSTIQNLMSWQNRKDPVITAMSDMMQRMDKRLEKLEQKGSYIMLKILIYAGGGIILAILLFLFSQMGLNL